MPTLVSPGVSVFVSSVGATSTPAPTTIPLIVLATRANKPQPSGTGVAAGTAESNRLRVITSQTELLTNYGNPVFVTSDGAPVQGDETDEYGLITAYSFLGPGNQIYVLRADIDLGQLVPSIVEPVLPPPDGTYWINSGTVVGGIFKLVSNNWVAQDFDFFTQSPNSVGGDTGDWGFDYSTLNGTIVFNYQGTWYPATTTNIQTYLGNTNQLWVSATTPAGAINGDYWYKTSVSNGGTNLQLAQYSAAQGLWISQAIIRGTTPPAPIAGTIYEDDSQIASTGARPLYVGTGTSFITLPVFIQSNPPVTAPATGTLWFNNDITDFALYLQNGSKTWTPITTTTATNPTSTQKVISASAPLYPSQGSIWVDVSTPEKLDNYPVINYWTGTQWTNISATVLVQSTDPNPTIVADGTYWLNIGQSTTTNTVKSFNPDFQGLTVVNGASTPESGNNWQPATGDLFGRLSQRAAVVDALSQVIVANQQIRAEVNYFQLIAVPGYPELYTDMVGLNIDNSNVSFVVCDTPKFMIPDGVPTGREITATEWITNTANVTSTGEQGFSGTPSAFAAIWYPWGLATNPTDGNNVFVPPSFIALATIAYSDSVSFPWFPPAGPNRGIVSNALSVGYLADDGVYTPVQLTRGQRDTLYSNAINPIADIPGQGLLVWGQKTLVGLSNPLDRINVARLVVKMQYDLQRLLEPFLFEINDPITQSSVLTVVERYLAGLKSLRALYDYVAICDNSNNPPAVVDANELFVDVAIQPAKSIEFIYVPISILDTGQTLPSA